MATTTTMELEGFSPYRVSTVAKLLQGKGEIMARKPLLGLCSLVVWACAAPSARAQLIALTDEIIVISKGVGNKHRLQSLNALGRAPGAGEDAFARGPAGRDASLDQGRNPAASSLHSSAATGSVLAAASGPTPAARPGRGAISIARARIETAAPLYGPLELPSESDEGPPDGLTIEQAIDRMVRANRDLRTKFYEIPQARADVLTAGLRANPLYFVTASGIPYTPYSQARPGGNGYSVSIVQPVDINHKRQARAEAAARAVRVLEAQYQNAVRLAIDELYSSYLDVLVARETLRYSETSLEATGRLLAASQQQFKSGNISEPDVWNVSAQYGAARIGVSQSRAQLAQAKQKLAELLYIPPDQAERIDLRGSLLDRAPAPPPPNELIPLAMSSRADLSAFRLGIERARADLRVANKEPIEDVFVIFSPYEFMNNGPVGGKNASSYSFGLLGTIPLFNRNQGEIRRARYSIAQVRVALAAREREVAAEVQRAQVEYAASRQAVEDIEQFVLPYSERSLAAVRRLMEAGEKSVVDYLNSQKDRNDVVRQYRDALIRHRRSMFSLNTAVGRRVLP